MRYGRSRRPPWWPENEEWPPQHPAWREARHRFMLRAFLTFVVGMFLVMLLASIAFAVAMRIIGFDGSRFGPPFLFPLLVIFAVLAIGSAASGRAFRRLALPLGDLVAAAGRVAGGEHGARVQVRGPRDVRALIGAFNSMADRLERTDTERKRLLADVSHELRTPLAVMQAELEALVDGVREPTDARLRSLLDETKVLGRLVEDLRTVSAAESGALTLDREPTDLGALARDVASSFSGRAADAGVALSASGDGAVVDADGTRLREVLSNLVENALHHTHAGGHVAIVADGATLSVRDDGEGIAADVLPRVFDRFYRGASSRGSGLGLAIAKDLVEAHGGTITATSEGEGRGAEFRIALQS